MSNLEKEITQVILEAVNMEDISVEESMYSTPLTEAPFEFDSIDFLEAVVAVEEHFEIKLADPSEAPKYFRSIETISEFVKSEKK